MQKLTCIFQLIVSYIAQLRAGRMEGSIVGGQYASIEDYPYTAYLKIKCTEDGKRYKWACGASIVNQNILLTAGHCFENCANSSSIFVSVGDSNKYQGKLYKIYSYVVHEKFDKTTASYDIGLLKTAVAIDFSDRVSRVAVMRDPPYHEDAVVAGWGITDEINNTKDQMLKFTSQKVWNRSDCLDIVNSIPEGTFCAASDSLMEYAANGDSGSALVVRGYIQIGIVSYKMHEYDNHLTVYTDIGFFYNWILNQSKSIACKLEE